jgi:hypothetical protein
MSDKDKVILHSEGDWDLWYKHIKAAGSDVWDYLDPEADDANILRLTSPSPPRTTDYSTTQKIHASGVYLGQCFMVPGFLVLMSARIITKEERLCMRMWANWMDTGAIYPLGYQGARRM